MTLKTWLGTTDSDYGTTGNWSGGTPVANDDVLITGSVAIDGDDQSAVELDSIIIRQMTGAIGSEAAYLQLDTADNSRVEIESSAAVYLDLGTAAVDVLITGTATAVFPAAGVYLKGSAIKTITVLGSSRVRLVETTQTADLIVGPDAVVQDDAGCTFIDADVQGRLDTYGVATDLRTYGGIINRHSDDNLALMGAYAGGTVNDYGGGTMTAVEAHGGNIYANLNNVARTYSSVDVDPTGSIQKSASTTVSAITGSATLTGA